MRIKGGREGTGGGGGGWEDEMRKGMLAAGGI